MFYLSTMYLVSIKYSINFIRCNVIFCLHRCVHTKNFISHVIAFKRCQIYLQWFFILWFGADGLICYGIMFHLGIITVVSYSPVFMPFAPVPSATILLFCPRFTRCCSCCFPWASTIVKPCVTNIYVLVSIFIGWLFSE